MTSLKNRPKWIAAAALAAIALAGCGSAASVASHNLSTAADNFQIARKITFYNGFTDKAILVVQGLCSVGNADGATTPSRNNVAVTCMVAKGKFVKDFMGLSDNVTYVAQQISGASVSDTHYRVIWRPSTLIPGVSIQPSTGPGTSTTPATPTTTTGH